MGVFINKHHPMYQLIYFFSSNSKTHAITCVSMSIEGFFLKHLCKIIDYAPKIPHMNYC